MRTAKELFQASPDYKGYAELLNNPAFETACAAALVTFTESLPSNPGEPSKAWDSYLQILGARAVLRTLSELHLKNEAPTPEPPMWKYPKKGK